MEAIEVKVESLNNKKVYACPFDGCSSVFDRPYRLAQHRLVHVNVKPFVCEQANCEKAYTSKSHLDRHIKTAHKATEVAEVNLLYCCPICMKKYVNRQNLKRHIKVSHIDNNKPFSCALCKMYFKKKHQLKAHMFIHNGLKPFRCPMCDRDFITLYEKKKHMRNHKVYKCEHCDTEFTRWTELMQHKRVDHVSPEYICHDCGKVFKERGHIIRHVKKHMPNAPVNIFFCPYDNCCRHYSRNSNLKQHILVKHEGMTFDCALCGAKLSTKAKLNEHVERHNRTELPVRIHKTLETGRKKRKDAGTIRYETAMRLAGIVRQKIDEGISRLYTENVNDQEEFRSRVSDDSVQNIPQVEAGIKEDVNEITKSNLRESIEFEMKVEHTLKVPERFPRKPQYPVNGTTEINSNIEIKVESNPSESTEFQAKVENILKPSESFTCQSQHTNRLDNHKMEKINYQKKVYNNKPTSLIELLNRPLLKINRDEQTSNSSEVVKETDIIVKIEGETDDIQHNIDMYKNTKSSNMPTEPVYLEHAGTSYAHITKVPIKVERNADVQSSNLDVNVDSQENLHDCALNYADDKSSATNVNGNVESSATSDVFPSLLQLYWKTLLDCKNM